MNYDLRNWDLLAQQLLNDPREISVINRAQMIDDSFNLARAGLLDYSVTFNITSYLQREVEVIIYMYYYLYSFIYIFFLSTFHGGPPPPD